MLNSFLQYFNVFYGNNAQSMYAYVQIKDLIIKSWFDPRILFWSIDLLTTCARWKYSDFILIFQHCI